MAESVCDQMLYLALGIILALSGAFIPVVFFGLIGFGIYEHFYPSKTDINSFKNNIADIDEMWKRKNIGMISAQVCCGACGGALASNCQCAKKRFIDNLTQADYDKFLEDKAGVWRTTYANTIQDMWQDRLKNLEKFDFGKVKCNKCNEPDDFSCRCVKKNFLDTLQLKEVEKFMKGN